MSLKVMSHVWWSTLPSQEKFVALALADYANDSGGSVYPSLATVARKTSRSERQVRRLLRKLQARGVVIVVQKRPGTTTIYRIDVEALIGASPDINVSPPRTSVSSYPGQDRAVTVDTAMSAESPINHHEITKGYGMRSNNQEWADERDRRRLTDQINQLYAVHRGNIVETDAEAKEQHRISADEIFREACRRTGIHVSRAEHLVRLN
jgi:DNA-binding transcriptional regulator LsrR (DeoR family)